MKNKKDKSFFVSTPIYYPSGNLHLGHLFSTTIAWVLKNYKNKLGYKTFFVTGQDEHGLKIQKKSEELNIEPKKYVDSQYELFSNFWKKAKIKYDFYSRTTNSKHKKLINSIFNKLFDKGVIYKGKYVGWYSVQDEEFITEKEAIKKNDKLYHPISNHQLEKIEEESYFFKLSLYQDWLIEYVKNNPNFITPSKIWKELSNNFLKEKLKDLSITRVSFDWGIKIDGDPKHVVYVWLDALFNYISALDYKLENESEKYKFYWNKNESEKIHIIGKEISRFHCIFWPIFLKSLDIKMPTRILTHGWIITKDGKMSKSKGNVINPEELFDKWDPEIVKFFLVSHLNMFEDSVFDENDLLLAYNADLANNIGNLVSRVIKMCLNSFNDPMKFDIKKVNDDDKMMIDKIMITKDNFINLMDAFEIDKAFKKVIILAKELNKYIDITEPWLLNENKERLSTILVILLNGIYSLLTYLDIVMPEKINVFKKIIKIENLTFDEISNFEKFDNILPNPSQMVFPRVKKN